MNFLPPLRGFFFTGVDMTEPKIQNQTKLCFKDICLRAGIWSLLIAGFLIICVALPLVALNL